MDAAFLIEPGEGGGWVGHAPMLPGCWTQGDVRGECLANLEEAAELWTEARAA